MIHVLADPAHARSIAAGAAALARERYGPEAYMARLESFLAQIPMPAEGGGRRVGAPGSADGPGSPGAARTSDAADRRRP